MTERTSKLSQSELEAAGAASRLALRPREAARILGIGERKLWELTNRCMIPHIRIGRCVRYPVDQLRTWLAEQAAKGRSA